MNPINRCLWVILFVFAAELGAHAGGPLDRLTSKPAPTQAPVTKLAVGQEFVSAPGQRRAVVLSENITLLVNQGTAGKHSAVNEITLSLGEVYVDAKSFTIKTSSRQVHITDGKVAVRVDKQGTGVFVTRGQANVAGVKKAVRAGYQLPPGATEPSPMPRASHVLDWTKEPISTISSPLIYTNHESTKVRKHENGAHGYQPCCSSLCLFSCFRCARISLVDRVS